jgi:acetoacetate decarboxylase
MGFVKTPEEIARIQAVLAEPHFFSAQVLTVAFRTRPEIVRHVLPPGREPAGEPLASAMVGRWGRSNCVHAFEGGGLFVRARHGDLEGDYCLAMPMSSDRAIIFGRELFGEPKKQAVTTLVRNGSRLHGRCVRYGRPIIEVEASMERKEAVSEARSAAFHYKFLPSADGTGLQWDPVLVVAEFDLRLSHVETGRGELRLGNTVHDPLGEIEIVDLVSVSYAEGDIYASCRTLATIEAEAFLPYAFAKVDDWTELDNEAEAAWGELRVPAWRESPARNPGSPRAKVTPEWRR